VGLSRGCYNRGIPDEPSRITDLLRSWAHGDQRAFEELIPIVHHELHQLARRHMAHERAGHSLQATALVNETYLRLVDAKHVAWHDRVHFLAVCARVMRRILVDHARARGAQKRGGAEAKVSLDEALVVAAEPRHDFVALDDALEALARFDHRKSRVIELRFFGGLTVEETASVINVSADTVMRDWQFAKVWLQREMRGKTARDP
jgi:RNA polymerase sigma factor (TIGR02999 family)